MSDVAVALSAGERRIQGDVASRIDRLPLTSLQYWLAGITQVFWGIVIANDAVSARIYPFVWRAEHILSTLQWDLIYGANVGAGILIGEYVAGYLSDRFGRKKILIASAIWDAAFLWPIALHQLQSFWPIAVFNLVYAFGMGGVLATNAVYLHEICPPHVRGRLSLRAQMVTSVCFLMPALLAYYWIPSHWNWVVYGLAVAVIVFCVPLGLFALPESPRWLEAKGRTAEAERIVQRWEAYCERRRGPLPEPVLAEHPVIQTERVPVGEVFRSRYGRRTLVLLFAWFFGYAGIVYGPGAYTPTYLVVRGWTPHQLFLVTGILVAPIGIIMFLIASALNERVERKNLALTGGLLFAAAYLLLMSTGHDKWTQAVLLLVAAPGTTLFLFSMYNYTSAAYPTRLRSVGTGWTDGVGHLGSFLAPLVAGPLFTATATASVGNFGWILWIAIPCAIFPALVIGTAGMKQRAGVLEQLST